MYCKDGVQVIFYSNGISLNITYLEFSFFYLYSRLNAARHFNKIFFFNFGYLKFDITFDHTKSKMWHKRLVRVVKHYEIV